MCSNTPVVLHHARRSPRLHTTRPASPACLRSHLSLRILPHSAHVGNPRPLSHSSSLTLFFALFSHHTFSGPHPTLPEKPSTGDETLLLSLQALAAADYKHALTLVNEALEQGISWDAGQAEALNLRGTFKYASIRSSCTSPNQTHTLTADSSLATGAAPRTICKRQSSSCPSSRRATSSSRACTWSKETPSRRSSVSKTRSSRTPTTRISTTTADKVRLLFLYLYFLLHTVHDSVLYHGRLPAGGGELHQVDGAR